MRQTKMTQVPSRVLWSVGTLLVALVPAWLFLAVRAFLSPEGFIQEFLMLGLGVWIFGGLQFFFLAAWIYFMVTAFWNRGTIF